MNRQSIQWLMLVGSVFLGASCAQKNGDINRVQPNAMKKADLLQGVWYFRNTVTKTPATTGFTFAGETGVMEKVVWEIQENHLVGYRAYPYILGQDSNIEAKSIPSGTTTKVCDENGKCVGGQTYYGAPLVAYPIVRHFDIIRDYSTSTGEKGNVIQENSTDRPWNEREYMRVNWSASLLDQGESMSWNTLQNPAGATDFNAWIQENEPGTEKYDWPTFEYDSDKRLKYMDFTGRYMARPTEYYFEGYGSFPACFLRAGHRYDCSAQQIQMRTSISRVDPKETNDYEPLVYGNELMSKFGYFRTERLNYDRKFGSTQSARVFLANRHRIFKSAFEKDAQGMPDRSRPIPLEQRELKPVVYYLTPQARLGTKESYDTYLEAARTLESNWDRAFRRAAAAAVGKDSSNVPQMFYVCENPVPKGAPAACGQEGFEAKFGDLRYSFLYTVSDPVPNGLLGYGPSSADPETGEIISANANTYSAAVESLAQRTLDTIDLLSGERTIDDVIKGEDVLSFMKLSQPYASQNVNQGKLESELQGVVQTGEETRGAFDRPTKSLVARLQQLRANGGVTKMTTDPMKAAADELARHPELESVLLDNPEVQADLVGLLPEPLRAQASMDPSFARSASRTVLTNVGDSAAFEKARIEWASNHNMYLAEFMDNALLGLAKREHQMRTERISALVGTGMSATDARRQADEEIRRRLRQSIWRATSEHEFGHTVGLRHNFQGSFDAVNYFDKYWDLRKETLTLSQGGQLVVPRLPVDLQKVGIGTKNQLEQGIREFEYSSIMDYGGKINADFSGIGKYDEAAILFAYSGGSEPGYVEVFENLRKTPQTFLGSDGNNLTLNGAAADLLVINAEHAHPGVPNFNERFHYSTIPLRFGEGNSIQAVVEDGVQKLRTRKLMKWSDVKKETERVAALLKNTPNPSLQELGNVPYEVPYMFCSDDHVGAVLSCNRFDRGPDYYEMSQTKIEDYWNSYFFSHFKRDRYMFTSASAMGNSYSTFLDLGNIYKHWTVALSRNAGPFQQNLPRYAYDPIMQDTWSMAVIDGLNANLAVMSVPPAGFYMFRNLAPNGRWDVISEGVDFDNLDDEGQGILRNYYGNPNNLSPPATNFAVIKRGQARRMYSRYDFKSGFGFFDRMLEAGHYNDQMGAMYAAVTPNADIIGTDVIADRNRYNIPYYLIFKNEMSTVFSSLWGNMRENVRPQMYLTKANDGKVTQNTALNFKTFVSGQNYIEGFDYPRRLDLPCTAGKTEGCVDTSQLAAPAEFQLTWNSRLYALYLGMALFRVNYDLDYAKENQIFKLGGSESFTLASGYSSHEVTDIVTGARYVAVQPTGALKDSAPVSIIKLANAYRQVAENPTMCPMPTIVQDGVSVAIDRCMPTAERNDPALVEQRRREFTEYFQNEIRDLDLMRGFFGAFGRAF